MSRTAAAVLLLGLVLLAAAWRLTPIPGPPLYDGLGLPAEPYRYLHPVQGQSTKAPTSAHGTAVVQNGQILLQLVSTGERPPQAELILQDNSIVIPPGVKKVNMTIAPVTPPPGSPDGTIDGNVYHFTLTGDNGKALAVRPHAEVNVQLRGTGRPGTPTLEQYRNGSWVRLTTRKFIGMAIYFAHVTSFGDFALVLVGKGAVGSGGGSSALPYILIGGLIVLLLAVGLLLIRLSRARVSAAGGA